jgi:hypothetical protein
MALFNFSYSPERIRQREQMKRLADEIYRTEDVTQPQAGPPMPGQAMPNITAPQAMGLLANNPQLGKLYRAGIQSPYGNQFVQGLLSRMGGNSGDMYANVTQDDLGNWYGLNKQSMRVEPIPQAGQFTKYKTVQSTDERGMPITELVAPSLLGGQTLQPRITVGSKTTLPTESESKSIAQSESALRDLQRLQALTQQPGGPEIGPSAELMRDIKTFPVIGDLAERMGYGLSTNDAQVVSLTTALSNQLLAAMRGAQVGPEEQKKFEKQLPMPGQPRKLFEANLLATKRNLIEVNERKKQLRGINAPQGIQNKSVTEMTDEELQAIINGD